MAITLGDMYIAKVRGTYLGEICENRWWYAVTQVGGGETLSPDLNDHILNNILGQLQDVQDDAFTWLFYESYLWRDPAADYNSAGVSLVGASTAATEMPSNVCITFRSPKGPPGTRYGYKRFSGWNSTVIDGNFVATPAPIEAVATSLGESVTTTQNSILSPALVITASIPPIGTGNPQYSHLLLGDWTLRIGSQNSRKPS